MTGLGGKTHFGHAGPSPDTPTGRTQQYLAEANAFWSAASDLSAQHDWPRYWLLYHSLEVALKGFLSRHDVSEAELKKIGHDVAAAAAEAERHGLNLSADEMSVIAAFEGPAAPSITTRYAYFSSPSFPKIDDLFAVVRSIVDKA